MLRKGAGGIVCRAYNYAFYKVLHAHFFTRLKENLRAAHRCGGFARRHHIRKRKRARIYRLENEQKRHNLCDGGGRQSLVCVMLKKHLSRCGIHKHGAFRRYFLGKIRRADGHAKRRKRKSQAKQKRNDFFHNIPQNFNLYKYMKDLPKYAKKQCLSALFCVMLSLFYDVRFEIAKDIVAIVLVDRHSDGIRKVEAENAHDRFGVNNVSAAGKVDFCIVFTNSVNKIANIFNS
jgi:hypothetical protein